MERLLVYVTPGESLSDAFPSWLRLSYDGLSYRPYDMNMPTTIPRRAPSQLAVDPPLTEHGDVVAQLTGKAIRLSDIQPTAIFSGPELRAVQTAASIAKALDCPCYVFVEPGLQGWSQLGSSPLEPLFPRDLSQLGLPVFEGYRPFVRRVHPSESFVAFTNRIRSVSRYILDSLEGPTIVVADSSAVLPAQGQSFRQPTDLLQARVKLRPCSANAFNVDKHSQQTVAEGLVMPVTATLLESQQSTKI